MDGVERVLVPTDGSAHANVAVEQALSLAKLFRRPVLALYVVDHPAFQSFPPESLLVDVAELVRKDAEKTLARIRERGKERGVAVETSIREGHPAEEICKAASTKDLIVIATHGRRGLSRMLLGSVAESVIRHAPCPVLVVRHADK